MKHFRASAQAAQEKRSQIELELVKLQAELKFLDETSRKELNSAIEELAQAEETVPDEAGLEEAERRCEELRAKIDALGPVNPNRLGGVPGSAAALRFSQRAASGPARFHSRYREGDSGDRQRIAQALQRSL